MDIQDNTNGVKTTELSLRILEELKNMDQARIEEISGALDIAPSTVHRHLQTLERNGYVVNEGSFYRLGFQFLTMGGYVRARTGAYDLAKESVEKLADQTQERVQFEVEEMGERIFIHTETGEHAVEADGTIGRRGPLHCSSAGKAILASLPKDRVVEIIESRGLNSVTENTITDREELFDELEQIRDEGVAFSYEESTPGLRAVGASVKLPNGQVLGGISVSGPAHRMQGNVFHEEIPGKVRGIAQELELNIKYAKNV